LNSSKMQSRVVLIVAAPVMLGLLASCGGSADLSCDKPRFYQEATEHPRVVAADGLTPLDPLAEMPVPEANPTEPRPKGSPCVDRPPRLINVD